MEEFVGFVVGGPIDGGVVAAPNPRLEIARLRKHKHPSMLTENEIPEQEIGYYTTTYVLEKFAFYHKVYQFWILQNPAEQHEFAIWQIQNVADTIIWMSESFGHLSAWA